MKLLASLILLFLIGAWATSESGGKPEEEEKIPDVPATSVSCSAFSAIKIRTIGRTRCKGIAAANCTAVASAVDDIQEAYDVWWSEGGQECEKGKIELAAEAVAHACAAVYTDTIAKVSCIGAGGFACGWAMSEGEGFAQGMAEAIAQAAVDASSIDSDAFCVADVSALAGAIAEAAASAESDACIKGEGSEADFQSAFVETIAEALADAYVKATAATCDAEGATAATSACYGEAGGDTKGDIKAKATEKAKATGSRISVELCDAGMDDCCDTSYRKVTCSCSTAACKGVWRRGPRRTWRKGSESCACKTVVT